MLSAIETRILLIVLWLLIPITGGLATHTIVEIQDAKQFSNSQNGYVPPKWLGYQIRETEKSMVTVDCSGSFGSGFSFNLDEVDASKGFSFKSELSRSASSYIVTNAHVIENCGEFLPKIIFGNKVSEATKILSLDKENDLALIESNLEIPPLFGAYATPRTGFWVMAIGSPHSFAGSVTFGNIINRDSGLIFTTASLSPGNSGGPLIDNEGYVFGVNSGSKPIGQNFNISIGINSFCEKLIYCPESKFWQEE